MKLPVKFGVHPKVVDIAKWKKLDKFFRENRLFAPNHGVQREQTQINGIREYVHGDRHSQVHWKSSARTGVWKSKEFEREAPPKLMILLDRHSRSYDHSSQFEMAVSVAASIWRYGIKRKIKTGFISDEGHELFYVEPGSIVAQQQMEQHFIEVTTDVHSDLFRKYLVSELIVREKCLVVLISPSGGEKINNWMNGVSVRTTGVIHFKINRDEEESTTTLSAKSLASARVSVYPIHKLEDLPSILAGGNL
jgi:hypothetical protein